MLNLFYKEYRKNWEIKGVEMEGYSIQSLTQASQCMYNLSEQVSKYENLKKEIKKLTDEGTRLKNNSKKNPYNKAYVWGLIGLGVGIIGIPVFCMIGFIIAYLISELFFLFDAKLAMNSLYLIGGLSFVFSAFLPVIFYGVATGITLYIMKKGKYGEKKEKEIKDKIWSNDEKQRCVQQETEDLLTVFNSGKSLLPYIPIPYQNSVAIRKFGDYFAQGRARNMQEAANLYEQDLRFEQQQKQLRQINNGIVANNTINAVGMAADVVTDIIFIATFI